MVFFSEVAFLAALHIAGWIGAIHALLTKHDPRSALGWAAVLIFLPAIGLVIYLVFGISRAQSRAELIMRRLAQIARRFQAPGEYAAAVPESSPEAVRLANIGHKLTSSPLCMGNRITPLHNGDQAYPAMLKAIGNARDHVFLSTYIFNYGYAAKSFIAALVGAYKRGVDVRVLVDGVGSLYSWRKPWRILAAKGVKTARFRPPRLFPPNLGINLRSHRKVLVCDTIGFTGGMNISDGNLINSPSTVKHKIQDIQFQCEGPIVDQLRKAFLLNWSFCTDTISELPEMREDFCGGSYCRVVVDGPGNDRDALNDLICGAINLSRQSVRIMTPYFLPTHDLMAALRSAAQRQVDVRVILPGKNNLAYMAWATERLLGGLLAAGVRIWYQAPPFAHTKLLTVDGFYSLVGSANLDARSLRLNFELNMEVYNSELCNNLSMFMDDTIKKGHEISMEYLNSLPLPKKIRNAACWIFSPYL